jgi:hypothetical protein
MRHKKQVLRDIPEPVRVCVGGWPIGRRHQGHGGGLSPADERLTSYCARAMQAPVAQVFAGLQANTIDEGDSFEMQPGDTLVLYTDGMVEAFSPTREPFGVERLDECVALGAGEPNDTVRASLAAGRCVRRGASEG